MMQIEGLNMCKLTDLCRKMFDLIVTEVEVCDGGDKKHFFRQKGQHTFR